MHGMLSQEEFNALLGNVNSDAGDEAPASASGSD